MLAISLASGTTFAQGADTLSLSATFHMRALQGTVGADLAEVYFDGSEHWWSLTLHGVSYSNDYWYYEEYDDFGNLVYFDEEYITRVQATSFDFQFFGPDAPTLNQTVSGQLVAGDLTGGAILGLIKGVNFDASDEWGFASYAVWRLGLAPLDSAAGVSFFVEAFPSLFPTDEFDYPIVEPQVFGSYDSYIVDSRTGNSGSLVSNSDAVFIGSAGPPPPAMRILDATAPEGNKGTSSITVKVTLSWSSINTVTVGYQTADGTATAKNDYTSIRGTLTFQPGQTSRTIAISIKADGKREPDESFTVRLSNAVGASIEDSIATVNILNDD